MFEYKEKTELVNIQEPVTVDGLSLRASGLELSFESLGALWERYGETLRGHTANAVMPVVEYGVSVNSVPDYIAGCAVTESSQGSATVTVPCGRYIKDLFNAKTFEELTTSRLEQRNVCAWAKEHGVTVDQTMYIEVYPKREPDADGVEMYTLTPVTDRR